MPGTFITKLVGTFISVNHAYDITLYKSFRKKVFCISEDKYILNCYLNHFNLMATPACQIKTREVMKSFRFICIDERLSRGGPLRLIEPC